jgi:hypothetical protein
VANLISLQAKDVLVVGQGSPPMARPASRFCIFFAVSTVPSKVSFHSYSLHLFRGLYHALEGLFSYLFREHFSWPAQSRSRQFRQGPPGAKEVKLLGEGMAGTGDNIVGVRAASRDQPSGFRPASLKLSMSAGLVIDSNTARQEMDRLRKALNWEVGLLPPIPAPSPLGLIFLLIWVFFRSSFPPRFTHYDEFCAIPLSTTGVALGFAAKIAVCKKECRRVGIHRTCLLLSCAAQDWCGLKHCLYC